VTTDPQPSVIVKRALARKGVMGDNCIFCGKKFKSDACPHSFTQNIELIKLAPQLKKLGVL
jgi:hypothetical protein